MGKGLTRAVLRAVEAGPTWTNRLARELGQRNREVGTILHRLERRGLIYSRQYAWTGPHGGVRELRAYFPAGMADGQPLPGQAQGHDLPSRAALRGLEEAAARMAEFADETRLHSPHRRTRRRAGRAQPIDIRDADADRRVA